MAISGNRSGERTEETSQNRCRSCDRPRGVHGKEEVEGSSPSKLFGGSQCSVPALPVEAVKDIELSHGTGRIGRQPRPRHTMSTRQPRSLSASRCPPGTHAVQNARLLPQPCRASETAVDPKSLQIRRFMAPGGIEPPHAASKAAALSAELRGRARKSVSLDSLRCSARAVAVAQLVELRVVVPVVAGSSPVRHPSSQARLERERHARARNGNVLATTRRSS